MVNWIKENKYKALVAGVLILILMSGALFEAKAAAKLKVAATIKYKTGSGWMFQTDEGDRFCATDGDGKVLCVDASDNWYSCKFEDPPQYFSDCVRIE